MTSQITFYFSQLLLKKFVTPKGDSLGKISDFLIDLTPWSSDIKEPVRPRVIAVRVKVAGRVRIYDFSSFEIKKFKGQLRVVCKEVNELSEETFTNSLWIKENILDKQIVDINGRKLVRVNDIRMVMIPSGAFALAVDVGMEGLLRRLGIERPLKKLLSKVGFAVSDRFILWDDIEAVDFNNASIKLSKATSRLHTLHPSDLADIIEDLDKASRTYVFTSLDEEKAADVLEELETNVQIHLVESLPKEKVADLLEKMPADEVADILDELEEEKAEELLNEMEKESSEEVRELLEYPDKVVGSVMTTDFMTFNAGLSVAEALETIRREKPEPSCIYSIFIVDNQEKLVASIPLGELVVADPDTALKDIMKKNPVSVFDQDKVDTLAELVSKYNLLAVPVINKEMQLEGVVVVEDIVDDLLSRRKTR